MYYNVQELKTIRLLTCARSRRARNMIDSNYNIIVKLTNCYFFVLFYSWLSIFNLQKTKSRPFFIVFRS